ncbi:MAG TPA: xanthine dehydrogenase family protein subunit M [Candidatus Binatia bacterium]|jgi:carbon-monoxide dehydrogenase medium subunit|nr:xanthine dehydrogenase family protein subunit M [Candidatus Binatia bacterium]
MRDFEYLEPTTVAEACDLLKRYGGEARPYAGGAYLSIVMRQGLLQPKALVNIKKIGELKGIRFDATDGLVIGALTTHRELETSEIAREKFPIFAHVEREVANIRVRNVGTIGGNLASGEPLTDLAQVFMTLDARVAIAGPAGNRVIPIEELFLDYYHTILAEDEILTHVIVPPLPPRSGIEYIRFSSSSVVDKPCVGVCVRMTLGNDDALKSVRVALGCVAPTPLRARKAEELLSGQRFSAENTEQAASAAGNECSPTSDLRGSERFKRGIVRVLVRRAAETAYERARQN